MTSALTVAVENPVQGIRALCGPDIRAARAWKAAPIKGFRGSDYGLDQGNGRITKAHARGTSIRSALPMRGCNSKQNGTRRYGRPSPSDRTRDGRPAHHPAGT